MEVASNGGDGMTPLRFTPMPLRVGGSALEPGRNFRGSLARLAVYGVALTPAQIAALAGDRSMKSGRFPGGVAEWTFPSDDLAAQAAAPAALRLAPPPAVTGRAAGPASPLVLWYPRPATDWVEALGIGNGRFGAMIFGRPDWERLQLNDITVWSGGPQPDQNKPGAAAHLPAIRQAIRDGRYAEASKLAEEHMTGGAGYGASYQTLGDIGIDFALPAGPITDYVRWLDIDRALAGVEFKAGGVGFQREAFASAADKVVVVRLVAQKSGALNFSASLSRAQNARTVAEGQDTLVMTGNTGSTLNYEVCARVLLPGGGVVSAEGGRLHVKGATEAVLILAAGTNYVNDWNQGYKGAEPHPAVAARLAAAAAKPYAALRAAHVADYQKLFRRVSLDLGSGPGAMRPTDERILNFKDGKDDPSLAALYYQFARYLLISSSRADNPMPSNSQGIWGDGMDLPWKCDYKSNINYEMNYWGALPFNLAECNLPMIRFTSSLVVPGRATAKAYFDAPGWYFAVMTNAWGWTAPGGGGWGNFSGAAGWCLQNFWDHYAFTRDKEFLRSVYPVMKEACEFYLAILQKDAGGTLNVSPASSPENRFKTGSGEKGFVSEGTSIENGIVWDLFNNTSQACRVLGVDAAFGKKLAETRDRIRPPQIGRHGQLMEWSSGDFDDPGDHHRHVSQLFPLHPGRQISPLATPALAAAAKKSLELRGDEGTGWSKAWKVNFWARLRDGDHAYRLLCDLLHLVGNAGMNLTGGGTYANMFDAHPPFQIDGNFGAPNGINEMLLQSQESYVDPAAPDEDRYVLDLLPALPAAWPAGRIRGLRARGGFELDLAWKDGRLARADIRSVGGTATRVRYAGKVYPLALEPGGSSTFKPPL